MLFRSPLDLTYKEFELLKYLVQHPGRVFTRAQLLQEVWGYDYYGGTRTVDVHVRRLRAKLGPEHEQLIGTVRNVGYRFDPPKDRRASEGRALVLYAVAMAVYVLVQRQEMAAQLQEMDDLHAREEAFKRAALSVSNALGWQRSSVTRQQQRSPSSCRRSPCTSHRGPGGS